VVGFEGERLFLMPQSDVEGVVPGSRVFPVEPSVPKPGSVIHPRRRPSDRARHLPVGWGCWAAWSTAPAARSTARVR
jgi:flagellum-specific ATP synthase